RAGKDVFYGLIDEVEPTYFPVTFNRAGDITGIDVPSSVTPQQLLDHHILGPVLRDHPVVFNYLPEEADDSPEEGDATAIPQDLLVPITGDEDIETYNGQPAFHAQIDGN